MSRRLYLWLCHFRILLLLVDCLSIILHWLLLHQSHLFLLLILLFLFIFAFLLLLQLQLQLRLRLRMRMRMRMRLRWLYTHRRRWWLSLHFCISNIRAGFELLDASLQLTSLHLTVCKRVILELQLVGPLEF